MDQDCKWTYSALSGARCRQADALLVDGLGLYWGAAPQNFARDLHPFPELHECVALAWQKAKPSRCTFNFSHWTSPEVRRPTRHCASLTPDGVGVDPKSE